MARVIFTLASRGRRPPIRKSIRRLAFLFLSTDAEDFKLIGCGWASQHLVLLIDCAGLWTACIHVRSDLFVCHVCRSVRFRGSNEDVIRIGTGDRLYTLIQNNRGVVEAASSLRLLACGAQITSVLTTIKFVHGNIHRVFKFSSLVLIEINRCYPLIASCIAFTAKCWSTSSLSARELGDWNVTAATHDAIPLLTRAGQAYAKIVETSRSTRCIHMSRSHACLTDSGDCVSQILIAE